MVTHTNALCEWLHVYMCTVNLHDCDQAYKKDVHGDYNHVLAHVMICKVCFLLSPPQASQLSSVISSLCDTVSMYSQSFTTERRVASECGAITALASRLFLTLLVKIKTGSALHQQLQVKHCHGGARRTSNPTCTSFSPLLLGCFTECKEGNGFSHIMC